MQKSLEDLLNTNVEPKGLALRRELPDMLRDKVLEGAEFINIKVDARTAWNLANDLAFAVKYRNLNQETIYEEETSDSSGS